MSTIDITHTFKGSDFKVTSPEGGDVSQFKHDKAVWSVEKADGTSVSSVELLSTVAPKLTEWTNTTPFERGQDYKIQVSYYSGDLAPAISDKVAFSVSQLAETPTLTLVSSLVKIDKATVELSPYVGPGTATSVYVSVTTASDTNFDNPVITRRKLTASTNRQYEITGLTGATAYLIKAEYESSTGALSGYTNTVSVVTLIAIDFSVKKIKTAGTWGGGETVNATDLVAGVTYKIAEVGTTNFTSISSPQVPNVVEQVFTATGPGTGTGKVFVNVADMDSFCHLFKADGTPYNFATSPTETNKNVIYYANKKLPDNTISLSNDDLGDDLTSTHTYHSEFINIDLEAVPAEVGKMIILLNYRSDGSTVADMSKVPNLSFKLLDTTSGSEVLLKEFNLSESPAGTRNVAIAKLFKDATTGQWYGQVLGLPTTSPLIVTHLL